MSNIYQFIELPRVGPTKKKITERKNTFKEIYHIFSPQQAQLQADRCLSCGNPYCQEKCPVSNNIPDWLHLVYEDRIEEAAELAHLTNSLPEICGRVCPQDRLCEGSCTLEGQDFGAVTIGAIEKYIVETAFKRGWRPKVIAKDAQAKKVAVVGSGPAGLACADFLNRQGVKVTVYERQQEIGGLLTFGIPAFKLEKTVLSRRRALYNSLGIEFRLGCEVGKDIPFKELIGHYDALFLATGVYQSLKADIPGEDASGAYSALPFLTATTEKLLGLHSENYVSMKGKRVLVLGGGDTAMDCVRTSIRQGAAEVTCVYRRDVHNMPGSRREYRNAKEEGAKFAFNKQPIAIESNDQGQVTGLKVAETKLVAAEDKGRARVQIVADSETLLPCDAIIIAFGFKPHAMPWLKEGHVAVDPSGRIALQGSKLFQTSNEKIFAGGDIIHGSDLVVTSILDGREAANSILDYLSIPNK